MSFIVYGPQGCGKTRHADRLRRGLKCAHVVEADELDWYRRPLYDLWRDKRSWMLSQDTVYITHEDPPHDLVSDRRVLSFSLAMQLTLGA